MELQSDLAWRTHINNKIKKANNMPGFLWRNLWNTSKETKTGAYISLVLPNLEYCCTIWNPHHKLLTNKIEIVQQRAARFTTKQYHNTSNVSDMLLSLHWESLESHWQKLQLTMFYKIIYHLVAIVSSVYLTPAKAMPWSPHSKKKTCPTLHLLTVSSTASSPDVTHFGTVIQQ